MVTQVVLFRWKSDIPDGQVERISDALGAIERSSTVLRSYRFGPDLSLVDAANFDYAVVGTFDDVAAWRTFDSDPDHDRVRVELIRPWVEQRVAVQFES